MVEGVPFPLEIPKVIPGLILLRKVPSGKNLQGKTNPEARLQEKRPSVQWQNAGLRPLNRGKTTQNAFRAEGAVSDER